MCQFLARSNMTVVPQHLCCLIKQHVASFISQKPMTVLKERRFSDFTMIQAKSQDTQAMLHTVV
jgi:hypothetical protein